MDAFLTITTTDSCILIVWSKPRIKSFGHYYLQIHQKIIIIRNTFKLRTRIQHVKVQNPNQPYQDAPLNPDSASSLNIRPGSALSILHYYLQLSQLSGHFHTEENFKSTQYITWRHHCFPGEITNLQLLILTLFIMNFIALIGKPRLLKCSKSRLHSWILWSVVIHRSHSTH